jgi:hypothetical protein
MGIVEEGLECDELKFMNKDLGNVEKSNNVNDMSWLRTKIYS